MQNQDFCDGINSFGNKLAQYLFLTEEEWFYVLSNVGSSIKFPASFALFATIEIEK